MNDFTKEELKCLENAIQLQLAEKAMSQINFDRRSNLRDKIQFMLDDYCAHEESKEDHNYSVQRCCKCDGLFLD